MLASQRHLYKEPAVSLLFSFRGFQGDSLAIYIILYINPAPFAGEEDPKIFFVYV